MKKEMSSISPSEIVRKLKEYDDIIVVGPDGSVDTNTRLRVYSNGGCIGRIATENNDNCSLVAKKNPQYADKYPYPYAKYLRKSFKNGKNKVINNENIDKLESEYSRLFKGEISNLEDYFVKTFCEEGGKTKGCILINPDYLKLAIQATFNKMRNDGDDPGERKIQTKIAKNQIELLPNQGLLVTDIEYNMRLSGNRPKKKNGKTKKFGKTDFVVFDGNSIGLVELKYNNKSMDQGAENSLYEHMLDFYDVITYSAEETIIECIRRMKYMADYAVIDSSWKAVIESFEKNAKSNSYQNMIWCGFLFASFNSDEEMTVMSIKNQLFTASNKKNAKDSTCLDLNDSKYKNTEVKYQYLQIPESSDNNLDMDKMKMEEDIWDAIKSDL